MISSIPLSWYRNRKTSMTLRSVPLPLSHVDWVYTGGVPLESSFEEVYDELVSKFRGGFLIRGCSPEIAGFLERSGCEAVVSGSEAVVRIEGMRQAAYIRRKSLRLLKLSCVVNITY